MCVRVKLYTVRSGTARRKGLQRFCRWRRDRYHVVIQTHNDCAETHLGGGDTSSSVGRRCSSALFDFRCKYSSYKGSTKMLTY